MRVSVGWLHFHRVHEFASSFTSIVTQIRLPDEIVIIENGIGEPILNSPVMRPLLAYAQALGIVIRYEMASIRTKPEARLRIAELCSSQLLMYADDDVVFPPKFLEKLAAMFEKNGSLDYTGSNLRHDLGKGFGDPEEFLLQQDGLPRWPPSGGTIMIRNDRWRYLFQEVQKATDDCQDDMTALAYLIGQGAKFESPLPKRPYSLVCYNEMFPLHLREWEAKRYLATGAVIERALKLFCPNVSIGEFWSYYE